MFQSEFITFEYCDQKVCDHYDGVSLVFFREVFLFINLCILCFETLKHEKDCTFFYGPIILRLFHLVANMSLSFFSSAIPTQFANLLQIFWLLVPKAK